MKEAAEQLDLMDRLDLGADLLLYSLAVHSHRQAQTPCRRLRLQIAQLEFAL